MTEQAPHSHGHRARLRARFAKSGLAGLADYEVVELLLTLAIPRVDVKQRAKALIEKFGDLRRILDAPPNELATVDGIGTTALTTLRFIREVANLYLLQRAEGREFSTDPEALAAFWRMRIGHLHNEVFEVALLDAGHRLLVDGVDRLQEGTIDRAAVYPRRVVEAALRRGAAAIVLAHNHPNGRLEPSEPDKTVTRAVTLAAEAVGLRLLDHVIVSPDEWFSFRKARLL